LANGKIGRPEMEEQEGKNQKLHGGISDDVDGADRYGGGNDKNDHTDENDLRGGVVQCLDVFRYRIKPFIRLLAVMHRVDRSSKSFSFK
jgi:hypothetical protein